MATDADKIWYTCTSQGRQQLGNISSDRPKGKMGARTSSAQPVFFYLFVNFLTVNVHQIGHGTWIHDRSKGSARDVQFFFV